MMSPSLLRRKLLAAFLLPPPLDDLIVAWWKEGSERGCLVEVLFGWGSVQGPVDRRRRRREREGKDRLKGERGLKGKHGLERERGQLIERVYIRSRTRWVIKDVGQFGNFVGINPSFYQKRRKPSFWIHVHFQNLKVHSFSQKWWLSGSFGVASGIFSISSRIQSLKATKKQSQTHPQ